MCVCVCVCVCARARVHLHVFCGVLVFYVCMMYVCSNGHKNLVFEKDGIENKE